MHTREQIRKLVTSETYEKIMGAKGNDLAKWNWQLNDKQDGIFPTNEEESTADIVMPEDELENKILKID